MEYQEEKETRIDYERRRKNIKQYLQIFINIYLMIKRDTEEHKELVNIINSIKDETINPKIFILYFVRIKKFIKLHKEIQKHKKPKTTKKNKRLKGTKRKPFIIPENETVFQFDSQDIDDYTKDRENKKERLFLTPEEKLNPTIDKKEIKRINKIIKEHNKKTNGRIEKWKF